MDYLVERGFHLAKFRGKFSNKVDVRRTDSKKKKAREGIEEVGRHTS